MTGWWLWLWLGCRPPPRFIPVDFLIADAEVGGWQELGARSMDGLQHDLERRRLVEVVVQGRTAGTDAIGDLPPEVAVAAYAMSARPVPTQHVDLRVPVDADSLSYRPVTLRLSDRVLTLDWGEPRPPVGAHVVATDVERQAVVRRFGIGALADGSARWTRAQVAVVDRALAAIEPDVLALVQGMPLVRETVSLRAPGRELAWFDPRHEPPSISLYDLAFEEVSGAVGPVDRLEPLAVMTLVHELGHVLADAPLRRAWLRALEDPADRDARRALRDLGRAGPVIDAWRQVRDHRAPTPYGARDAHESFAEAYALHRLDPEALREVMPRAAAWFDAGSHLRAARLASDD